ncbi:MAG: DUF2254 domain-containing protein [Rhodobacterales bacterium]|nr:DUF2254 domain-containing protein [Rhodobacterales bacterium]
MITRPIWYLREILKKVWARVIAFALLAVFASGLARVLAPIIPDDFAMSAGAGAVESLLGVLTSSMLAVTTFSLSIAVSAFAAAAGSATPRATILLQEDNTTQNVLATFLGAFLFGLVGLIAIKAQLYGASGRVILFFFTIAVIGLVVVALIRWIGHLMQFGRMDDILDRVEKAASRALGRRLENPWLGGNMLIGTIPAHATPIVANETGYVQHIDMQALQDCAEDAGSRIFLHCLPGRFVAPEQPLLYVDPPPASEDASKAIRRAVVIGTRRTFEGDPRFGLIVLSEIASRALSPAVNDPGTAIDILGRHVRILSQWRSDSDVEVEFSRIFVPAIALQDLMEDAFRPISRDGAALSEVQIRLQKGLASLCLAAPDVFAAPCDQMAREALQRAEGAALLPAELARIRASAPLR